MAIGGWLLCALPILNFGGGGHIVTGSRGIPQIVGFSGFPIFFAAIIGMMFFVKCPRCSARLAQITTQNPFPFGRQLGRFPVYKSG